MLISRLIHPATCTMPTNLLPVSAEAEDARPYLSSLDQNLHAEANFDMTTEKRIASGESRRRAGTALLPSPRPTTGAILS